MAGFFPHIGNTNVGGFTPLPMVPVTGFLDSLVQDLTSSAGGGVNGWSLYDDMRGASGLSNPLYPRVYTGLGAANYYGAGYNTYSWNFTSGSQRVVANINYGFNFSYAISSDINNLTPVSTDLTNWYNAFTPGVVGSYTTMTLDQNWRGANGTYGIGLYTKVTKQVVLQCSSSQKVFYVLLGQATERAGGPVLYTQIYETWNSSTHAGTVPSALEHTRFIAETLVSRSGALVQYMAWFLPGALGLWTQGRVYQGGAALVPVPTASLGQLTEVSEFTFVGNLDTTDGLGSGSDPDAVAFIPGDTSQSGYHATPISPLYWSQTSNYYMPGAVQCLRTYDGVTWGPPTIGVGNFNKKNCYVTFPRGRIHVANSYMPMTDIANRQWLAEIDVWHAGAADSIRDGRQRDIQGLRGKIPFLKCPILQPGLGQLSTIGPCSDGFSYVIFKTQNFRTAYYNSTIIPATIDQMSSGFQGPLESGWAVPSQDASWNAAAADAAVEDFTTSARPYGISPQYFAMPIF